MIPRESKIPLKGDYGWFDIDLYHSFPFDNLAQWSWALSTRHLAFKLNQSNDKKLLDGNPNIIEKWFSLEVLESLEEINFDDYKSSISCVTPLTLIQLTQIWYELKKSSPLSAVYQIYLDLIDDNYKDESLRFLSKIGAEWLAEDIPNYPADYAYNYYCLKDDESIKLNGYTILSIDLNAPDTLLIEEFKNIIKKYKQDRSIGLSKKKGLRTIKKITKKDLERWHNQKILAYLDIKFWSEYSNDNLTYEQIGNLLFPNEYDISLSEKVRNTVSVLADGILNPTVIKSIKIMAQVEFDEFELMKGKTDMR